MVDRPNNPVLALDVQKMQSWIAPSKLMYQGDKGYNQPFRLTNAWNDYQVNANNLCFSASKPDGNVIEVENEPDRFTEKDGIWYFKLPDALTQAIGSVTCFFYVKDNTNNIVASTTKFSYRVEAKFNDEERSVSYVSILERLQKTFETYVENAKNEVNKMDSLSNEYKQKLNAQLDQMSKQVQTWITAKTTEIDADIKSRQDALNKLNTDYQNKYNELVTNWNNQITAENSQYQADKKARDSQAQSDKAKRDSDFASQTKAIQDRADNQNSKITNDANAQKEAIQSRADKQNADIQSRADNQKNAIDSSWNTQSKNIDADYKSKLDKALKDITNQRDAKISQIDKEWAEKKTTLQADIDKFKNDLLLQVQNASDQVKKLIDVDLPAMNKKAEEVQAKVDKLAADFSKINFDDFVKKDEFEAALVKKASGLKVRGLSGDYVMAVDNSTINGTPSNTQPGLVDMGVLSGAIQVMADAILDKNHYTKDEVDKMKNDLINKINSEVSKKADASALNNKADKSEVTEVRTNLNNGLTRVAALENAGYVQIKRGFATDEEARKYSAEHHCFAESNEN